jgi:hypothetical protein
VEPERHLEAMMARPKKMGGRVGNGTQCDILVYNQCFGVGFTDQQKKDLVNFLNTL